jgi:NADH:ubiquinone oxidoreductase subunit
VLSKIFTWWNGATLGTLFTVKRRGSHVGTDTFGNRYFQSRDRKSYDGRKRRWVLYNGYVDASKVPPEWFGWLHYSVDEAPSQDSPKRRDWQKDHVPNLSGTPFAWKPRGSIARGGQRASASGDYQAWRPE